MSPSSRPRSLSRDLNSPKTVHRHRPDYILLIVMVLLLVIGLVVIYSISSALGIANNVSSSFYISRQLIAIGLGIVAFVVVSRLPLSNWKRWGGLLIGLAAAATLLAIIMPVNPNYPAHRWVRMGGLSFESVELLKLAIIVWLAALLDKKIVSKTIKTDKKVLRTLVAVIVIVGFVVAGAQSDLGSTAVIVIMMGVMAFVAGMPMKRLITVVAIIGVLGVLAVSFTPYRRERLMTFFHPATNCQTTGYQTCQALISVGSGGMFGLGLGQSVQAYGYLPEAANDSIFAIYAEKFGFVGVVILLGLFGVLFSRMKNIAERANTDFGRLIVIGILVWLGFQVLVNVGAMIGLLPLKGITLPFVSYGGTSVIFTMTAVGLVFNISRYTSYGRITANSNRRSSREDRTDGRRIGRTHYADSSSRR